MQGAGFCLYQTLNLLHWVRPDPSRRHRFIRSRESRNTVTTGPVGRGGGGRGAEAASRPTASVRLQEILRKPRCGAIFIAVYSSAPGSTKPADSIKPIVSASSNRPAVPDARCPLRLNFPKLVGFSNLSCGQPAERSHLEHLLRTPEALMSTPFMGLRAPICELVNTLLTGFHLTFGLLVPISSGLQATAPTVTGQCGPGRSAIRLGHFLSADVRET